MTAQHYGVPSPTRLSLGRSDIYVPLPGRLTLTAFPNYIFVYAQRQWFSPPGPVVRRAWPAYRRTRYRGRDTINLIPTLKPPRDRTHHPPGVNRRTGEQDLIRGPCIFRYTCKTLNLIRRERNKCMN